MDQPERKTAGKRISASLVISVVALLVSAATLYYQFLRGPAPTVIPAKALYASQLTQVGMPLVFYNSGAATAVVKEGSLELSAAGQTRSLSLKWTSPFESKMILKGSEWSLDTRSYNEFTVVVLKPGDTDSQVYWFESDSERFALSAGHYRACAKFFSVDGQIVRSISTQDGAECSIRFEFDLADSEVKQMNDPTQHVRLDVK